jgi:hypothetical protein
VDPIVLDRRFQVWRYGVGHSQLLMHSLAEAADSDHLNVLFEDVRAVKLRWSYHPLVLMPAGNPIRNEILSFADIPERHQHRYMSLTLSTRPDAGFVLCARATVLAVDKTNDQTPIRAWSDGARVIHTLRPKDQVS